MRGRWETHRAPAIVLSVGLVLALGLPGAGGADPTGSGGSLRDQQAQLGNRSHAALLSLYSLDARLTQARATLASLQLRVADVRAEQARVAQGERIARKVWRTSVDALGARLRTLYERGQPDAIAVIFGATSIDDALTRIDELEQSARLSRETIAQTRAAEHTLANLQHRLAARAEELRILVGRARQTAAALEQARAQRVAYLASLARQRTLTAGKIARLDAAAQRSASRSQTVAAAPTSAIPTTPSQPVPAPPTSGQTMTVSATGYSLPGHTATGLPVGWGIVAVDPSVIPLGTRMTIPGYGEGVAADTGSAVQGATIDLWFPTPAQAMAWGRRTVVITLH